jgi:hypothetical protein
LQGWQCTGKKAALERVLGGFLLFSKMLAKQLDLLSEAIFAMPVVVVELVECSFYLNPDGGDILGEYRAPAEIADEYSFE